MFELEPEHFGVLLPFVPDVPGATIPVHCLTAGMGEVFVDDLSSPSAIAVTIRGLGGDDRVDLYLYGNAKSEDLAGYLTQLREPTEVHGDARIGELVTRIHTDAEPRETVVFSFDRMTDLAPAGGESQVRRILAADVAEVSSLVPSWAWGVMGDAKQVLQAGAIYGAIDEGKIVCVAFLTDASVKYETLVAVTAADHRRRGHALACSRSLMRSAVERGRLPRMEVGTRNEPALGLAAKLEFPQRTDVTSYFVDVF
jgi:hypothetical protein